MTLRPILYLISSAVIVGAGCNEATDASHDTAPVIFRNYDQGKGGVQITELAYDQTANGRTGVADEFIVLKSDVARSLHGWKLNAGDAGQNYQLPDSISSILYIYTHAAPHPTSRTEFGLNLSSGKFIWNNSDADTASLYNEADSLIDRLTYKL